MGLPDKDKKEITDRIEKGELKQDMVADVVAFKKAQPTYERKYKGEYKPTQESKEKYIYGKLVQSLSSIIMLGIGWTPERVSLIDKYAKANEKKKIVGLIDSLVEKWSEIQKAIK